MDQSWSFMVNSCPKEWYLKMDNDTLGKTIGKTKEYRGLMGFNGIYPPVMTNIAVPYGSKYLLRKCLGCDLVG